LNDIYMCMITGAEQTRKSPRTFGAGNSSHRPWCSMCDRIYSQQVHCTPWH